MPPPARTCSECPRSLAGLSVRAKTCSNACRLKRSRRVRRANQEIQDFADANNAGAAEVAAIVRREAPDVVTRVMHDQLQPIVREALTEDVLRAINGMVGLTSAAVDALQEDLASDDATIRQRAYSLVIKYTIGHPALVKPSDTDEGKQLTVNFNLPRPDVSENTEISQSAKYEEYRTCDICHEDKTESEFVAGSDRCQDCFRQNKVRVIEAYADAVR